MSLMQELPCIEATPTTTSITSTATNDDNDHRDCRISTFGAKIAYVPQRAWIFLGTIKENILFGSEYNQERFWKVIHACVLDQDLITMPLKELTMVGEKGYKLSGGQKARINLARALYADADLYLLDDPISALDVKVAKIVVQRFVLKKKFD